MKQAVVIGVLVAASASVLPARVAGQQPEGFPAAGTPATVTMASAGAAPRVALRYAPAAGAKQHFDMTMNVSMGMEVGGSSVPAMSMPTVRMGADCVVTEVTPSGDVSFATAFTGTSVDPGADPALTAQLQAASEALASIKGSATISNRGLIRTSSIDTSKVANGQLAQMLGSTTELVKNLSIPFPEEPVGVGARWEARSTLTTSEITLFQKVFYELVAFDGKTVTLKSTTEQSALPQTMSNPALPPGADVQLAQFTGKGAGTMRIVLSELVPVSDGSVDSTMVMNVSMGGMSQQMVVNSSVKMTIAPGK
jgi:hypothetical protein